MPPAKKAAASSLADLLDDNKNNEDTIDAEHDVDDDNLPEYDDRKNDPFLSENVVSTVPNKTPAELSGETPEETAARYNITTEITDEDADNPRVQVYDDTRVNQVPSGTHLHPDIAKSAQNRGIAEMHTDNALVRHPDTAPTYDFAPDAETNDKWVKPVEDDDDYEDVPPNAGSSV